MIYSPLYTVHAVVLSLSIYICGISHRGTLAVDAVGATMRKTVVMITTPVSERSRPVRYYTLLQCMYIIMYLTRGGNARGRIISGAVPRAVTHWQVIVLFCFFERRISTAASLFDYTQAMAMLFLLSCDTSSRGITCVLARSYHAQPTQRIPWARSMLRRWQGPLAVALR